MEECDYISIYFYYQELTKSHQVGDFLEMSLSIASYQLKEIIDKAKEYWILLDGDTREHIIRLCDSPNNNKLATAEIQAFKEWSIQNQDVKQDYNTPRPLVDVLPVVNYKKRGA